jgi:23S rRNA (guanine2445-N2)-methyltransferase / 23S rRNA (guanine2069-N7)-methyltransferase
VAVDLYGMRDSGGPWVHVQEYEPPKTIDPEKAAARLREATAAIPHVLDVPRERIFLKVRRKRKRGEQYEKMAAKGEYREVTEDGCRFLVNFTDYLDTGLFLDHRITRRVVAEMADGKRFLNLFAYTGTATVYAARGGAASTTTVDMSNTYLDWAKRNLELNGIGGTAHRFVRDDCLEWMEREKGRYDLIFLDPPTFSTSKKMDGTFDVQRDHVPLLRGASRLLAPGGTILFSTNSRKFRIDGEGLAGLEIEDITAKTIPEDFRRNPRIHRAFLVRRHDNLS